MGIGALASALPQLRLRDEWIGWTSTALAARVAADGGVWPRECAALVRAVERSLPEVRSDDLGVDLTTATPEDEQRLLRVSEAAGEERRRALEERSLRARAGERLAPLRTRPTLDDGRVDWYAASEAPLFRRKRARLISELLLARRILAAAGGEVPAVANGEIAGELGRAVAIALKEIRKRGLASRVVDLSVCGAAPPYGALLAGKLVALAATSAEMADAYRARYTDQVSEIASQVAGRQITRDAGLGAISTTSLYATSASQYNRLRIALPAGPWPERIAWEELGVTSGFGTIHLRDETVEALRVLAVTVAGARSVNNIFGEGPSPRLRQTREGLEALGIEPDVVLQHDAPRRVYGLALSPGARSALRHDEACEHTLAPFSVIVSAWLERWLVERSTSPRVLERVASEGPDSVSRSLRTETGQLSLFL
jgi:hypothetical protein